MQILLVDDSPIFSDALINLISSEGRIKREDCRHFIDPDQMVEAADWHSASLVVMEVCFHGQMKLQTVLNMLRSEPDVPFLIMTHMIAAPHVLSAFDAGARGFIGKDQPPQVVNSAIRLIIDGGTYFPLDILQMQAKVRNEQASGAAAHANSPLSPRQIAILQLIAEGHLNREVADRLKCSEPTVKADLSRAMEVLGARSRAHAVSIAIGRSFVKPDLVKA